MLAAEEDVLGQRLRGQDVRRLERDHPLDHVLQLAHVARPVVLLDARAWRRTEMRFCGTPMFVEVLGDEVVDEQRDVFAPLAQRRQRDRDDVDAVEEVLAERAVADRLGEVAVGRGDDAHVDLRLDVRADLAHDAILQHAQQLDLHRRRGLADLVEEDRAAVGLVKESALLADGAGERAALVAEELGLQQRLRQRAAVDRDELAAAAGVVVDGARDELLARARLAGDQHGRHGLGDALHDARRSPASARSCR